MSEERPQHPQEPAEGADEAEEALASSELAIMKGCQRMTSKGP